MNSLKFLIRRCEFLVTELARLRSLPRQTRVLLCLGAAFQIVARASLNVASVSRVISAATWLGTTWRCRRIDTETLRWALAATAARTGGTCLTQAIAARVFCGWAVPQRSILIIGVRQVPGAMRFHAWTEIDGVCIPRAAGAAESFVPLKVWS
jgi:transglutaminase superfamily protein